MKLYFLIGENIETRKEFLQSITNDREVHLVDRHFSIVESEQVLSGGLFGVAPVLVLRGVWSEDVRSWLKDFQKKDTNAVVVVVESSLAKKDTELFTKKGATRHEFPLDTKPGKKPDTLFAVAQALAMRDKKNAWMLYRDEVRKGAAPEQIHGILIWKMRDAIEKKQSLKIDAPVVMRQLVSLYHEAHRGGPSLDMAIEHLLLSL